MVPLKKIMTSDVITVFPETKIYEAMNMLTVNKISGLPVVGKDNQVVGILTEKDVLKILINSNIGIQDKVEDYMTRNVVTFPEATEAITVCEFFIKHSIRRVPVTRDGKIVGIVSRRDIISLILEMRSKLSQYRFS